MKMESNSQSKGNEIIDIPNNQDLTKTSEMVKKEIPKYWERDYINQRINSISNHNHKMLIIFLWRSGVRITEAINLTKGKIDFDNYVMTVRWLKSRKYNERVAPLHPELRNLLQLYSASMKADDKIFPLSRQRAWQITKKYLGGSPHQLRHSFAVNWLRCDGDLIILHRILGHSKIQTTMEYLKIVPIDQGKELSKIQF
jgi:integrase